MARKTGPRQGSSDGPQDAPELHETSLELEDEIDRIRGLTRETIERIDRVQREVSEEFDGAAYADNESGGNMGARLANLERDVTEIKVSMGKIETRIARIESDMLTKGFAAVVAVGVMITIVGGAWWIVQQYLAPLIQNLPKILEHLPK
jgi:hypothetical protein